MRLILRCTKNQCLLNLSGVLPGVGRPMARAPATEPLTSGHLLLGRRVQLASAALEKLAVCKGPAAAKPSAWAPTRDLYSALTAGRDTTTSRARGWRPEGSGGRRRGLCR